VNWDQVPTNVVGRVQHRERPPASGFRERFRRSIRTKLTVSHVIVVTMSTFIYAAGGFFLLIGLYVVSGWSVDDIRRQLAAFFILTVFTLFHIFLITICGIVAATIASGYM